MKIIITGASGLIGKRLCNQLKQNGFHVDFLERYGTNKEGVQKDCSTRKNIFWSNPEILENADAVVHLAGANVAKPWTKAYKKEILESRTIGTTALMQACSACSNPPKHIISASGIGYYAESVPDTLTEESSLGDGFLAEVCKVWEESLFNNNTKEIPLSVVRTGLVLSNKSKIVEAAKIQFLLSGMVGSVGSHINRWSWIHIVDLCNLYIALIDGTLQPGMYNGVAPNPCTQGEFGKAYERHPAFKSPKYLIYLQLQFWAAKQLNGLIRFLGIQKRPIIPEWVIKLAWGERSVIALTNQYVSAQKTLSQGFCYQYPTIDLAMQHLQGHPEI